MNSVFFLHGKAAFVILLVTMVSSRISAQVTLRIDARQTIREYQQTPIGINVNYLMDGDYLNPISSTVAALKKMGVKFLRYPGGEKSDNYLWSIAPWNGPNPHFARTGSEDWPSADTRFAEGNRYACKSTALDFDEFMALCQAVNAEPVLVVCFDAMYKAGSSGGTAPSKQLLKETAVEWVRYANVTKGYGVMYWEIGNESYHSGSYNGIAPNATTYAQDLIEFARAMKAVDPTIKIGANGKDQWWDTLLNTAGEEIDFLAVHTYPTWDYSGYNAYRDNSPVFAGEVNSAISAIGSKNKFVALTEFNAIYWGSGTGWSNTNDLGHSLAVFDIAMQNIVKNKVAFSLLWNTRWVDNKTKAFEVYDAIDKDGKLYATGNALSIIGNYLLPKTISVSGLTNQVRAWTSMSAADDTMNVFILNKSAGASTIHLSVEGMQYDTLFLRSQFSGSGPEDTSPVFAEELPSIISSSSITAPGASITVVSYVKNAGATTVLKHVRGKADNSISADAGIQFYNILGRRVDTALNTHNEAGVFIKKTSNGALLYTIPTTDNGRHASQTACVPTTRCLK